MLRYLFLGTFLVTVSLLAVSVEAQSKKSFDIKSYLDRLDANKNGLLDPDEMKGRSERFLKGLGFDTSKPVRLQDVVRKISKDRKNAESRRKEKGQANLKVPGFGVEREVKGVNDFSATVESDSGSSLGSVESRYGKEIASQVEDVLKRYDTNKNGRLDPAEIKNGRWGSPSPGKSDLNRDGYLTKSELARRYVARKQSSSANRSSRDRDRDRDRERDRDRRRSDRDNRSSRDRGSRDRDRPSSRSSSSRRDSDRSSRSSKTSSETQSSSSSSSERYNSYAKSLIKKYDTNGDGKLDKKEMGEMRAKPKESADANKDGYITVEEFADSLSGKTSSKSTGESKRSSKDDGRSSRSRSRSSRSSRRSMASSFAEGDRNGDGQILMSEFATEWSKEEIEEFERRDLNGDGVITDDEWAKARSRK